MHLVKLFELLKKSLNLISLCTESKTKNIFGYFIYCFTMVLLVIGQIVHLFTEDDWQETMENLSVAFTGLGINFKLIYYLLRTDVYNEMEKKLFKMLDLSSKNENAKNIMREKLKLIMMMSKVYASVLALNAISCLLFSFGLNELPFKVFFPFTIEKHTIGFYIAALYVNITCTVGNIAIFFCDLYPVFHMIIATGMLNEISLRLRHLGTDTTHENEVEDLIHCVKVHAMVRSYVRDIEKNFELTFLLQGSISGLIIGLSAFSIMYNEEVAFMISKAVYCLPIMLQIFLPCYFGNELTLASENLMTSAIHSKWFRSNQKTKKMLLVLQENVKKPMKISSFGIMSINLSTFNDISQSGYSLFAVLRRLNK